MHTHIALGVLVTVATVGHIICGQWQGGMRNNRGITDTVRTYQLGIYGLPGFGCYFTPVTSFILRCIFLLSLIH